MKSKETRLLDAQGRVILPSHIRKALNLKTGSPVHVEMADDGTITISPAQARCAICGERADPGNRSEITVGPATRYVCHHCGEIIAQTK